MDAGIAKQNGWVDFFAERRLPRFILICLAAWLNAADALVTATIMPSVGANLHGYSYFGWATAAYLLASIVAGASAGRLSERLGLRFAIALAGLVYATGCILSAVSINMEMFLAGRLVQGLGAGWIIGFSYVAIGLLFPQHHLARMFAAVSSVWGLATLLGPLVGGVFAQVGNWRGVFWFFAIQALLLSAAAPALLKNSEAKTKSRGIPLYQLTAVAIAVSAIAVADVTGNIAVSSVLIGAGLSGFVFIVTFDSRAKVRLLPHRTSDLSTICGSGYATIFLLCSASVGVSVYAPTLLQLLYGFSPLASGYVIATEAMCWTVAAFLIAGFDDHWECVFIRIGASLVIIGLVTIALSMRSGPPAIAIAAICIMGTGFGLSWSFISRGVIGALSDEDKAIGSSAIGAVRQAGAATGAAISAAIANFTGFSQGLTLATASSTATWVFWGSVGMALAGWAGAWTMTRQLRAKRRVLASVAEQSAALAV